VYKPAVPQEACNNPRAAGCYDPATDTIIVPSDTAFIDSREFDGVTYNHSTLVHEVGHSLGLSHPGQALNPPAPPNTSADYDADPSSIMGRGWILHKDDFQKAFCSQLPSKGAGAGPWTAR